MHLENLTMVWAFLAVAVPVAIHYVFKRRYETYPFGAMTVLRLALARRRDRVLLEQIVMIAARCLMLALLAAAMLYPVIGQKAGETRPSTCMVLLFDNSYSMLAGEDLSRLERARFIGGLLMDSVEPQDEVYVGTAADPARLRRLRPFRSGEEAKAAIRSLPVAWKPRALADSLRSAGELLAGSQCKRKELFVFTDSQKLGFGDVDGPRWKAVAEELMQLRPAPRVFWVEPGMNEPWSARTDNLVVQAPRLSSPTVHAAEPVAFYVNVANTAERPIDRADVSFSVSDKVLASTILKLPARGQATARFTHTFPQPGPYHARFQVRSDTDILAVDDAVLHALAAEPALPVLIVDGNLTPEPLHNESDLLRHALAPPPRGPAVNMPYAVQVVSPLQLHRLPQWRRHYSAIFFLNVRDPDEALITRLEQYVAAGGGLLIALGDRCDKAYYNSVLYRDGRGLLPCRLVEKMGDEAAQEKFQTPHVAAADHPVLSTLGENEAGFENVHVRAWFKTQVPPTLGQTRPLLTLAPDGDPLLYERPLGRGVLYVMTTALNTRWSDFPIHPSYVLLMRGLADSLRAARMPPLNIKVGEPIEARFAFDDRGAEHTLTAPLRQGERLPVRKRFGTDSIRFDATDRQGLHTLVSEKEGRKSVAYYGVNPDTAESDLTPMPAALVEKAISLLGARRVGVWEDLEGLFRRARRGLGLWWVFLALAGGFAVLEIALARHFQRSFVDETMLAEATGT